MSWRKTLMPKKFTIFLFLVNKEKLHQDYIIKKINDNNLDWRNIYLLVRIITKDSKLRAFQFFSLNY